MVPTVLGNTVGGLFTGSYVKRYISRDAISIRTRFADNKPSTARYKLPITISGISAVLCSTLLILTWRGDTPLWQAMFVFLGGFATGIIVSATFVDLAAAVDESDIAIAGSGLYLSLNIGSVSGASAASAIFSSSLLAGLKDVLSGLPDGDEVQYPRSPS